MGKSGKSHDHLISLRDARQGPGSRVRIKGSSGDKKKTWQNIRRGDGKKEEKDTDYNCLFLERKRN